MRGLNKRRVHVSHRVGVDAEMRPTTRGGALRTNDQHAPAVISLAPILMELVVFADANLLGCIMLAMTPLVPCSSAAARGVNVPAIMSKQIRRYGTV